jgi:hypothetical protein
VKEQLKAFTLKKGRKIKKKGRRYNKADIWKIWKK